MRKSVLYQLFAWFICFLAAIFYGYDFFIRVAPSVMVGQLKSAFGIDSASIGFLSAAYFYAYILFQVPAGIMLDKYNQRWIISGAMFLCMVGNFLFSFANIYFLAFLGRVFMGVGSAFGFIGAAKLATMWLPRRFLSFFISLTTIIGLLGGLVADTFLSELVNGLGWRHGNNVFTYIGLVITVLMIIFIKDNPEYIEKYKNVKHETLWDRVKKLPLVLKNLPFWAVSIVGGMLFIPINVLASLWGVSFIEAKFGVAVEEASELNSLLFIGNAVGCSLIAVITIFTKRYRFLLLLSCILSALLAFIVTYMPMPIWLFIIFYFLIGVSIGPQVLTFGIGKAVCPEEASATAVAGVNMINNLIGTILLPLFGWLLMEFSTKHHVASKHVVYSLNDYYFAMGLIPLLVLICIPLLYCLPKHTNEGLEH